MRGEVKKATVVCRAVAPGFPGFSEAEKLTSRAFNQAYEKVRNKTVGEKVAKIIKEAEDEERSNKLARLQNPA